MSLSLVPPSVPTGVGDATRILLVGSDLVSIMAPQRVMEACAYDVFHVRSYESGLHLLMADLPVDVVLLDGVSASERDLDVCRRYRLWNLFPGIATIALVAGEHVIAPDLSEWVDTVLEKSVTACCGRCRRCSKDAGQAVRIADSGAKALKMLDDGPVDLVITDLGMPQMNGWELAEAIKAWAPWTPVVVLTGWGEQGVQAETRRQVFVDRCLFKPVQLRVLMANIAILTEPARTHA